MATRYYDVTDPTPKTEKIAAGLDVVHSSSTRRRDAIPKSYPCIAYPLKVFLQTIPCPPLSRAYSPETISGGGSRGRELQNALATRHEWNMHRLQTHRHQFQHSFPLFLHLCSALCAKGTPGSDLFGGFLPLQSFSRKGPRGFDLAWGSMAWAKGTTSARTHARARARMGRRIVLAEGGCGG